MESLNIAKSYSKSLTKETRAYNIVNELFEEKLLVANKTTALYDGEYSNELLIELAKMLNIDEIVYYNSQGEFIYSIIDELIGWKTYEGHPVHDFMKSDSLSLIGDIRPDSITGNSFNYGYFKVSDGGFLHC